MIHSFQIYAAMIVAAALGFIVYLVMKTTSESESITAEFDPKRIRIIWKRFNKP
jgi:hypothetical protein